MNIYLVWLRAALIRALKTFGQSGAAALLLAEPGIGFVQVGWAGILSFAGLAAVASLLTSLAGLPEVPNKTDEIGKYERV